MADPAAVGTIDPVSPLLVIAIGIGAELVVAGAACGCTLLVLRLLRWLETEAQAGESDPGGGGGEDRPPDAPSDGGGDPQPVWWPQFERELADYLDRSRRAPSTKRRATPSTQTAWSSAHLCPAPGLLIGGSLRLGRVVWL